MDEALELTKKWDQGVLDKNIDALLELVADDYVRIHDMGKVEGKDQLRAYLMRCFNDYDLVSARSKELFITPSKGHVVIAGSWKGTLRNGTVLKCEWNDVRKKINDKWVITYSNVSS
jgi:ketosteroid isomerase-like protein